MLSLAFCCCGTAGSFRDRRDADVVEDDKGAVEPGACSLLGAGTADGLGAGMGAGFEAGVRATSLLGAGTGTCKTTAAGVGVVGIVAATSSWR